LAVHRHGNMENGLPAFHLEEITSRDKRVIPFVNQIPRRKVDGGKVRRVGRQVNSLDLLQKVNVTECAAGKVSLQDIGADKKRSPTTGRIEDGCLRFA